MFTSYSRLKRLIAEPSADEEREHWRRVYGGTRLASPQRFRRVRAAIRIYAVVWAVALVTLESIVVSGWYRPLVAAIFMLLTPALDDIRWDYNEYVRNWHQGQRKTGGDASRV